MNRRVNDTKTHGPIHEQANEQVNEQIYKRETQNEWANERANIPDHALSKKKGRVQPSQFQSRHVPTLAIEASKSAIPPVGRGCRRSKASTLQYHAMTYFEEAIGE